MAERSLDKKPTRAWRFAKAKTRDICPQNGDDRWLRGFNYIQLAQMSVLQQYIPNYSQLASPFTDALRKGEPVKVQ